MESEKKGTLLTMRKDKLYIIIALTLAALLMALLLCGCKHDNGEQITSPAQLNDPSRTIGAGAGSADELRVRDELPKAKISYIEVPDAYKAVQQGKIDAYAFDRQQMQVAIENGVTGVKLLDETIGEEIPIAVGISPVSEIPDLQDKVNQFIDELRKDGTLDDMYKRWVVDGDETMPDIPEAKSPSCHLIVGTTGVLRPYTYYVGTDLNGYDIELAKRFAAWLDADLEFQIYDYNAIVIATHTGDIDCVMANLNVTPEREEAMLFSEPLLVNKTALMVKDMTAGSGEGFVSGIEDSFHKTFIREDRWKLFMSGIFTTLLITLLSILAGTLLGFSVYLSCRSGSRIINQLTRFTVWLVQGLPVVVLLMILYYIVFGNMKVSGVFVAVIGFTLVFGASVYGMLKTGISAIDIGQTEAAYSLGYTDRQTFFKVILPQAMPFIIEPYKGEVTALIKATAVVGYIAVQDLTKMGDVVRSRTYEAFFPLIAVAVIYFVLAGLLKRIVDWIEPRFNPKRRSREDILKGVVQK